MSWRKSFFTVLAVCLLSADALAKVWLLPDYQQRQLFSGRVNASDAPNVRPSTYIDCHKYGLIFESEISHGMTCAYSNRILNTTCFGNCSCSPSYNKTVSSCRSEGKIPAGEACMDEFFTECICDTSLYPHTSSSCAHTLSGASCSDNYGEHFAECKNPCDGLADNSTDLGCQSYYKQCPSKCEVGKTCVPKDCSEYSLSSCPDNASCASCTPGCGTNNTKKYKVTSCQNNTFNINGSCKTFNGEIAFTVTTDAGGKITLGMTKNDYLIEWGNGEKKRWTEYYPGTGIGSISYTYPLAGDYEIKIVGNIKDFRVTDTQNLSLKQLKRLDLETITSYSSAFSNVCDNITGTIPDLPPYLEDASSMFEGCKNLTGKIPEFPDSLVKASSMFEDCNNLSGGIPKLPDNLANGYQMFYNCKNLTGQITNIPSSLQNGYGMFAVCGINSCTAGGLTGTIPPLPASLSNGGWMFFGNPNLSGSFPKLPEKLVNGEYMFDDCAGLTGNLPDLPSTLKTANDMFAGCTGVSGKLPKLPNSLKEARRMFMVCGGSQQCGILSGNIPPLPSSLEQGGAMFAGNTNLTGPVPELPSGLVNGNTMFSHCESLSGNIPELPETITDGIGMFQECKGLTGNIPQLPPNMTKARDMFKGCAGLTGQTPIRPEKLTSYADMFTGTQVILTSDWSADAKK